MIANDWTVRLCLGPPVKYEAVEARKQHNCTGCRRRIKKGEVYIRQSIRGTDKSPKVGDVRVPEKFKWHVECVKDSIQKKADRICREFDQITSRREHGEKAA